MGQNCQARVIRAAQEETILGFRFSNFQFSPDNKKLNITSLLPKWETSLIF
jgi:hypothetical protein